MSKQYLLQHQALKKNQRGVVLIVALIMLLLLSIVGVAAIRGSSLQEAMASNMRDRSVAFSAAEAGLRVAEGADLSGATLERSFDGTQRGYYSDLNSNTSTPEGWNASTPESWDKATWLVGSVSVANNLIASAAEQPRYVIEYVPTEIHPGETGGARDEEATRSLEDLQVYRITSRGVGMTTDSEVILQSTFVR